MPGNRAHRDSGSGSAPRAVSTGPLQCTRNGVTFELLDPLEENRPRTIPAGVDAVVIRFRFRNESTERIKALRVAVFSEYAACEITRHEPSQHFERVLEYRQGRGGLNLGQQKKPSSSIQYVRDGIPVGRQVECGMVVKLRKMEGLPASEVQGVPVKFWEPRVTIEADYQFVDSGSDRITLNASPGAIVTSERLLVRAVKEFKEAILGAVIGLAVGLLCPNAEGLRTAIVNFLNALSAAVGGGH